MSKQPARLFTLDEANATLPLVRVITRDMVDVAQRIINTRERLSVIRTGRDFDPLLPMFRKEVEIIEAKLDADYKRLDEFVAELQSLGVEPEYPAHGLVDFPSIRNGKKVYLCWRYGETAVQHWHTLTGGFVGRKRIESRELVLTGPNPSM